MRILSAADVRTALPMSAAIEAMRIGFIALSSGRATVPLRTVLPTPDGVMLYMPAYLHGAPVSVVKIVSVYPGNPARDLPTINASVLVLDTQTGVPLALMDGTVLTAIRTGAASGLATDLLARQDARILGVIGSGVQARTQIEAICAVRPIEEIRVYSPHRAAQMVDELQPHYSAKFIIAYSQQEALQGADILVAATNSSTPVVTLADIAPGVHINGVGSFTPQMQEVAAEVVAMAKIVVDHRPSAWTEAGDLIIPRDQGVIRDDSVYAELGEIAAGQLPGRENEREITFFKSVGNAVQDAAAAAYILKTML